jgi:hypothetical protein
VRGAIIRDVLRSWLVGVTASALFVAVVHLLFEYVELGDSYIRLMSF